MIIEMFLHEGLRRKNANSTVYFEVQSGIQRCTFSLDCSAG